MGTFIVIEGRSSDQQARRALGAFERPPTNSWNGGPGLLCAGVVHNASDARLAVLAALAGADLVVDCRAPREVIDIMCDDLRRLGHLDHRVGVANVPGLDDDQSALLTAIATGHSLGSAAAAMHLSRRTADRRIAAARITLGAANTAEAVVRATRLGLLDPPRVEK